ncbi:hypothetical protein VTO42DRAFT_265 [Malbranchea cinnamomea]
MPSCQHQDSTLLRLRPEAPETGCWAQSAIDGAREASDRKREMGRVAGEGRNAFETERTASGQIIKRREAKKADGGVAKGQPSDRQRQGSANRRELEINGPSQPGRTLWTRGRAQMPLRLIELGRWGETLRSVTTLGACGSAIVMGGSWDAGQESAAARLATQVHGLVSEYRCRNAGTPEENEWDFSVRVLAKRDGQGGPAWTMMAKRMAGGGCVWRESAEVGDDGLSAEDSTRVRQAKVPLDHGRPADAYNS